MNNSWNEKQGLSSEPALKFQLKQEQQIKHLLLEENSQNRQIWRLLRLLRKLKWYLRRPKALFYKLGFYASKLIRSKSYHLREFPDQFTDAYQRKTLDYVSLLRRENNPHENSNRIDEIIHRKQYKGILVYPSTIHWEPLQRPQQILRVFAKWGYLCFFCEPSEPRLKIKQLEDNLYIISGEQHLIYPLQHHQVTVLCTWMLNLPFINMLPNRILWYDIIDALHIFSLYDQDMFRKHEEVVMAASIVTYSGLKLKEYAQSRADAVYVPNGVTIEDFENPQAEIIVDDPAFTFMKELKTRNRPVIGFYGAIAEWVDLDLIKAVADQRKDWEIVLIGRAWVDISDLQKMPNIHYLGLVAYSRLPALASQLDVAMIPFVISEITDCVSPIKLFEYAALGLPVVATPFFEIRQYEDQPFIRIVNDAAAFIRETETLLIENNEALKQIAKKFAQEHQWSTHLDGLQKKKQSTSLGAD